MSRPAGSGAKPSAAFTTIAAPSPSRRANAAVVGWVERKRNPPFVPSAGDDGFRFRSTHPTDPSPPLVNLLALECREDSGVLRMDMSLVAAVLANQTAAIQSQVSTSVLKQNLDAQKSAVLTLLGAGEQTLSLANVGAGIGGNLNISA